MSGLDELRDIETFLYDEADCLDRADLNAWFELYTKDATYWMPAAPDQDDPDMHISLFYDDNLLMEIRRRNFGHWMAASMEYPVRCSHVIGNVRIADRDDAAGTLTVTSNFQAVVYYREQTVWAGRYTHELVRTDAGFRIRRKRVDILNCDAPLGSLVIYL